MKCEKWKKVMEEEYNILIKNTRNLMPIPRTKIQ